MINPPASQGSFTTQTQESTSSPITGYMLLLVGLTCLVLPAALAYGFATAYEQQVVAIFLAVLGIALLLVKPFWGLVFFLGLLYMRPEDTIREIQGFRLTFYVSVLTLIGTWFQLCVNKQRFARVPVVLMMAGFALLGMYGGARAKQLEMGLTDFLRLFFILYLTTNLVRSIDRFRMLVTAVLIFTFYLASYGVYRYFTGAGLIQQYTEYRTVATGIFGDPNDLAATLIVGIALVLTRIKNARGMKQAGYVFMFLTMLFTMALTESRGGMIALLVVIGGFFWEHVKNKSAAITAASIIGVLFLVAGPARMTTFDSGEQSANSRFHFWHNGFDMLKSSPIFGVGFRSFKDHNDNKTAHNTFVLCFAELGLTGFFVWMGTIYYALLRRKKEQGMYEHTIEVEDDYKGARLALIGYLAAGFWISRLYSPILYVAISLPAAHAVACLGEKERPRYDWEEVWADYKQIAKWCGMMILAIYILVFFLAR